MITMKPTLAEFIFQFILFFQITYAFVWQPPKLLSWQSSRLSDNVVCIDIPSNITLCQNIGYKKMRLPNLLHHDSLQEVSQQAASWIHLIKLNCNPNTQLFLCSVFAPVCLADSIPPCRSLCQTVQSDCENTMTRFGYPWPKILDCYQFPIDNNMCIQAQSVAKKFTNKMKLIKSLKYSKNESKYHKININQPSWRSNQSWNWNVMDTKEMHELKPVFIKKGLFKDIIDHFCSSEWSLKVKAGLEQLDGGLILKAQNYKVIFGNFSGSSPGQSKRRRIMIRLKGDIKYFDADNYEDKQDDNLSQRAFFVMGTGPNLATYTIIWPKRSKKFRKALNLIRKNKVDCAGKKV